MFHLHHDKQLANEKAQILNISTVCLTDTSALLFSVHAIEKDKIILLS